MSTITATFKLEGTAPSGSDPVGISIAPALTVSSPSVTSGTYTTVAGQEFTIIPHSQGVGTDHYVYIRNAGSGTGNVKVLNDKTGVEVAILKKQDFIFFPIRGTAAGNGIKVAEDTAATDVVYGYWKRT